MSTAQNKALVLKYNKEVIEKGDMDVLHQIATPNFVNHSALEGMSAGVDGMVYFFKDVLHAAFTNVTVEVHDMIAEVNKVTTRKTINGTHSGELFGIAPTGKNIAIKVIDILTVENDKITEHWGQNNFGAVLQSLQS